MLSIAGATDAERSFSADTGMGECPLIARKTKEGVQAGQKIEPASNRAAFVILKERPASQLLGANAAQQVRRLISAGKIRNLEDGPVGGTPVYFGDEIVGQAMTAPLPPPAAPHPRATHASARGAHGIEVLGGPSVIEYSTEGISKGELRDPAIMQALLSWFFHSRQYEGREHVRIHLSGTEATRLRLWQLEKARRKRSP